MTGKLMSSHPNIALAILAAGRASRFGGRKLEAMIDDAMIGTMTAARLSALDFGARLVVVDPAHIALIEQFAKLGFKSVANDQPDAGLSRSVSLAAQAAQNSNADALLICLADMPNVPAEHIAEMIEALGDGTRVIAASVQSIAMPPALFPRAHFPRLAALSGADGAKPLLTDAILIEADAWSMADVDTVEDLATLTRSYPPSKAQPRDPS
jgi:molybdenum cofactor cytidylyltransferase